MYNKVIIAGNLVRDIEIKYTQSGSAIGNTGIATTRKFKTQSGEQKEEVLFVDITFFGRTAEIANQYLRKGAKILVDGRLKFDQWTAQDGTKRSKHSVTVESMQMLGSKDDNNQQPQHTTPPNNNNYQQHNPNTPPPPQNGYNQPQQQQVQQQPNVPQLDISDDQIPF